VVEEEKKRWAAMPMASCTNLFVIVVAFHNAEMRRKRDR